LHGGRFRPIILELSHEILPFLEFVPTQNIPELAVKVTIPEKMFGFLDQSSGVYVVLCEEIHDFEEFVICVPTVESSLDALKKVGFINREGRAGAGR
jgi:hypothetical protein